MESQNPLVPEKDDPAEEAAGRCDQPAHHLERDSMETGGTHRREGERGQGRLQHDYGRTWASDHGTELEISPGQAHTRLSIVERRHQVLRRGIEMFLAHRRQQPDHDPNMPHRERIIQALRDTTDQQYSQCPRLQCHPMGYGHTAQDPRSVDGP